MATPRIDKAVELLRQALGLAKKAGRDKRAEKIQVALKSLRQDDHTKPVPIRWPGVIAARDQSAKGGLPGVGGPNPGAGWCLKMVRLCYSIPAREADAIGAWSAATHKHRQTDPLKIPRGYPVFWSGGSAGHGHIAVSAGDGFCWSTDIKRIGYFDRVPISEIHDRWGLTLLGWTEDLNGATVPATT